MVPKITGIAPLYVIFFLYVEPFFAFSGAYYAFFEPEWYLELTHAPTVPKYGLPTSTQIVMYQLANLYLLFAINEAIVLRATSDLKVWQAVIIGLLLADFGHLYSVSPLGTQVYHAVKDWNIIHWGNIGFVYVGALLRISFLIRPAGFSSLSGWWTPTAPATPGSGPGTAPKVPRRSSRRPKPSSRLRD